MSDMSVNPGFRTSPDQNWRLISNCFRPKTMPKSNSTNEERVEKREEAPSAGGEITVDEILESVLSACLKRVENRRKQVKKRINLKFFRSIINGTFSANNFQTQGIRKKVWKHDCERCWIGLGQKEEKG